MVLLRAEVEARCARPSRSAGPLKERFQLALETIQATVSIGVAHFPRDAATPEELIAQADAAMYQAKSQGRNRVVDCQALRQN